MVTAADNELLTRSERGTAGGRVLRQYWQPAALTEELAGDRPVVAVTLMNEKLVLFRDDAGELGLMGRACPHRGVDLTFGRVEENGLRCPFHGWLFDTSGRCVETPAEPEGSDFCNRITQTSYPVVERNGIVWAFLGEGEPPSLPGFDCFNAPESHVFAFKGMWDCNWVQSHEVGVDPAHAQFLHRFLEDETGDGYGQQFRDDVGTSGIPMTKLMRESSAPKIIVEPTTFGFRMRATRDYEGEFTHVRISNCIFPNAITISMSREMSITQWHVPIDDTHSYWYSMFVSFGDPVDGEAMRAQRIDQVTMPDYRPITSAANSWGYDPAEQRTTTYTGMGRDINVHDQWAVESQGALYDRADEQLSPSDVGIRTHRRMFLAAAKESADAPTFIVDRPCGPIAIDAITTGDDFDAAWRDLDHERRTAASWGAELTNP